MEELITAEIKPEELAMLYKNHVLKEIEGRSVDRVKALLNSMEDDLITTRAITLQACMLAIT